MNNRARLPRWGAFAFLLLAPSARADLVMNLTLATAPVVRVGSYNIALNQTEIDEDWAVANPQDFPAIVGLSGDLIINFRAPAGTVVSVPSGFAFLIATVDWSVPLQVYELDVNGSSASSFINPSGMVPPTLAGGFDAGHPQGAPGVFGSFSGRGSAGANAGDYSFEGFTVVIPALDQLTALYPNSAGQVVRFQRLRLGYFLPGRVQPGFPPAARTHAPHANRRVRRAGALVAGACWHRGRVRMFHVHAPTEADRDSCYSRCLNRSEFVSESESRFVDS